MNESIISSFSFNFKCLLTWCSTLISCHCSYPLLKEQSHEGGIIPLILKRKSTYGLATPSSQDVKYIIFRWKCGKDMTRCWTGVTGDVYVYLGPLEDTINAKDVLAVFQRSYYLLFKGAQTDVTFICTLSHCCVWHGWLHILNITGHDVFTALAQLNLNIKPLLYHMCVVNNS